jgi:hypothetical protein
VTETPYSYGSSIRLTRVKVIAAQSALPCTRIIEGSHKSTHTEPTCIK